jgi:hypothetical protein
MAGSALGRTIAQVAVDGTFPNAEMKKKIEDKWDGLHARVAGLLAARQVHGGDPGPSVTYGLVTSSPPGIAVPGISAPAIPPPSIPPPAIGAPGESYPVWPGDPGAGESSDEVVVPGGVIGRGEVAASGDEAGPAAELQRQRKDLRLLLGESGLIGERTCREAIADVRAELRYLEQPDALLAGPRDHRTEAEVADLLRQRKGLRGKLIARQLPEDFYNDEVADISAELRNLGWSQ